MREIIDKLCDGVFEYESEKLVFDVHTIEENITADEPHTGTIKITSEGGSQVKGLIYTSTMRMVVRNDSFLGTECEVEYVFDPTGLEAGDDVKGDIRIVSSAGEYYIPFAFYISHTKDSAEKENVRNLFHLTNLAQTSPETAVNVFYSDGFVRVFDGNDRSQLTKYRGFSNLPGEAQALEDFLISVNKKKPVIFSVNQKAYEFTEVADDLRCEVILHKSTWGYFDGEITSDSSFIEPEAESFTPDDFEGNEYKLVFYIRVDELHEGKNFGKLYIKSANSEETITIIAMQRLQDVALKASRREMKSLTFRLMKNYLKFRTKQINVNSWVRDSMKIVERMNLLDDKNPVSRLFQAQLLIVEDRTNEAKWILDHVSKEMNVASTTYEIYSYYLYLMALYERDEDYVNQIAEEIYGYFQKEKISMPLLWMLIYLDEDLAGNNTQKLTAIEHIFQRGVHSPILYVEAYNTYVTNPSTLNKLSDFEIQVLNFAVKNGRMSRDIIKQVSMIALRFREYNEGVVKILGRIYDLYNDPELVDAICTMLIRAGKTDVKYHKWYKLGVELELRITKLYEYFMYSVPPEYDDILPKAVIMYFGFQNQLHYTLKAYLYANLIEYKRKALDMFEQYYENIQVFAVEQVYEEHINKHLAIIYDEMLNPGIIRPNMANSLAKIIFAREITAPSDEYKNVVVIQEEFVGEFVYPIDEKLKAYPLIYSRNISVFFEDEYGHRVLVNPDDIKRIVNENNYVPVIRRYVTNNLPFFLYLCEGKRQYIEVDDDNVDFCRDLVESNLIAERLKADLRVGLLHHYYDSDRISTLDEFLLNIDIKILTSSDRSELIDFLIKRTLYERAYELICIYGDEKVSAKSCLKICTFMINKVDGVKDVLLLKIAYNAFKNGKYDINTLEYLVNNFEGTTKELRDLWLAAKAFDVDYRALTEKIIIQMLFTRTMVGEKEEIFEEYLKHGTNTSVEMAYLSYAAYDYFVKERITDKRIFEFLVSNYRSHEILNDACKLALLKHYSENPHDKTERIKDMITAFIQEFLHKNIYFKFFSSFIEEVPELAAFSDALFVEYRTNPGSRVVLHYILEDGQENEDIYRTEEMRNMFGGVFSKEFILFFGEHLQYYVTEERNGREMLTLSDSVSISETSSDGTDSRYNLLNDMVVARTLQDDVTLMDLMEEYVEEDFFAEQVFNII